MFGNDFLMMNKIKSLLLVILSITLNNSISNAQQDLGYPLAETFTPKEYKGGTQNWAICESDEGLIYVGNREGLLEFDGVNWRKIEAVGSSVVRSLAKDKKGRIYVGKGNDFGYLTQASIQSVDYHSLATLLPDSITSFQDIWTIHIIGKEVYFQASDYLFIYDIEKKTIHTLDENINRSRSNFTFENNYYINSINNEGHKNTICRVAEKEARFFSKEIGVVRSLIPYKKDKAIIISGKYSLCIYDFEKNQIEFLPKKFEQIVQEIKKENVYNLIWLDSQTISVATIAAGIFQINLKTGFVRRINDQTGLPSNAVFDQFLDSKGNLWLAQDESIVCLRYSEPLNHFNKQHGLKGTAFCSYLHDNGDFYVGTNSNFQILNKQTGRLELTNEAKGQIWQIFEDQTDIHTVRTRGLLTVGKAESVLDFYADPWMLVPLAKRKGLFVMANYNNGLSIVEKKGKVLQIRNHLYGFKKNSRKVVEDYKGNFWVSDRKVGVGKLGRMRGWIVLKI